MKFSLAFKSKYRGAVTIRVGKNPRLIMDGQRNSIAPQAKEITAKNLIRHPSAEINQIKFYLTGTEIYSAPITNKTILANQQVQFDANLDEESFTGNFDKVALVASGIGAYAELVGLSIHKGEEPLLITWTIKVI